MYDLLIPTSVRQRFKLKTAYAKTAFTMNILTNSEGSHPILAQVGKCMHLATTPMQPPASVADHLIIPWVPFPLAGRR